MGFEIISGFDLEIYQEASTITLLYYVLNKARHFLVLLTVRLKELDKPKIVAWKDVVCDDVYRCTNDH